MTQSINQLINHKGAFMTAPVTPGLLTSFTLLRVWIEISLKSVDCLFKMELPNGQVFLSLPENLHHKILSNEEV